MEFGKERAEYDRPQHDAGRHFTDHRRLAEHAQQAAACARDDEDDDHLQQQQQRRRHGARSIHE